MTLPATAFFPIRSGALDVVPASCVGTKPTAAFTANPISGSLPLSVTFQNTSAGSPTSWSWSFGDDQTESGAGPFTHVYASAGTFPAVLTVGNACGFSSFSTTITVTSTLTADFVGVPVLGPRPLTVVFTDQSTGNHDSWAWTFGDGGSDTTPNPTHTYTSNGLYSVSLSVSDGAISSTKTKNTYINVGCVIPTYAGSKQSDAQATWTAAGFTTTVLYAHGNSNSSSTIKSQTIPQEGRSITTATA